MTPTDPVAGFHSIVLPYLDDAYSLARWLTGNGTDAEDVVQDACVRAFRGIDKFANRNPRAWVLTIVRHTAYDWLGRNRPAALVLAGDPEAAAPQLTAPETPESLLLEKDNATRLQAAIAALPPQLRETLVLRDIHNLAYREIVAVTGVPMGTVMSRLSRARRSLVITLGIHGHGKTAHAMLTE